MQEAKVSEEKLTSAIQRLQEAAFKKIDYIKILELRVNSLIIENAKLHDEIENLKKEFSISTKKTSIENKKDMLPESTTDNQLLSADANQDIDISIRQLKNILGKRK
jgi:hypothetical protein